MSQVTIEGNNKNFRVNNLYPFLTYCQNRVPILLWRLFELEIKCLILYSRLNEDLKTHIKTLIGDGLSSKIKLENLLMDECGTDRKDVQDLLSWWFRDQHSSNLFFCSLILTYAVEGFRKGFGNFSKSPIRIFFSKSKTSDS